MVRGCTLNEGSERKVVATQRARRALQAHTEIVPSQRAGPPRKTGQEKAPTPTISIAFSWGGGGVEMELSLSFVLQWCNLTLQIFGGQIPTVFLTAENNKANNTSALQAPSS